MDYTTKLAKNFTLGEIAGYRNDNIPYGEHLVNAVALCNAVLQPLRNVVGAISINSGYRCLDYNKRVGGATNSQHTKGQAADITMKGNIDLIFQLIIAEFDYDQIILEDNGRSKWIHISYNIEGNRKEALTYKDGKYTKVEVKV